jgi:hypothetical protein
MRWKNSGLIDEFARAHPRLQALALYADRYCIRLLDHDLFVTDVERTQEEYDLIYHATPYVGPKPHLAPRSRAIDFRTVGELSEAEVGDLVDHLNSYWVRSDGKPTAIYHDVAGPHVHLQVEA